MRYTCNNIFMVRTPSLSADKFRNFMAFDGTSIEEFLSQESLSNFMEKSILLSSRDLSNARKRDLHGKQKKSNARELSLRKFFTRASTRPTPYGLFAGAALGEFSDDKNLGPLVLDETKSILECRTDFSWLAHFTYEMENHPLVFPQLQVRFNSNCYVSGDRLKNPYYSNHGFLSAKAMLTQRNHIRNTPLISFIRQQAKTFIGYRTLQSQIQSRYPNVPEEKIVSTLNTLMENEILLTNLRVPANCEDGLAYVRNVLDPLDGIDFQKETLQKIHTLIQQIHGAHENDHIHTEAIETIYTLMDSLITNGHEKDLLCVNRGIVLSQNKMPLEVKTRVEQFVEALTYLQVEVPSRLETFKRQFQEEYGRNIEVPLCTIIDENDFNGLSYLGTFPPSEDEKDQRIKQIVDEKILCCLQSQQEEVFLHQSDFSGLGDIVEEWLPESFDTNFFVTKKRGRYHLWSAPIGGSGTAEDMFNRFAYVLDDDLFRQYKENNHSLQNSDNEYALVEIREGYANGRISNVNNHRCESQFYIALATNENNPDTTELTLDDLLVGMEQSHLYIKSKRLGKRCKFRQNCMVNPESLSGISKLLIQISADTETSIVERIFHLFQNNYVFLPRISLEDVVLYPKRWNLPAYLFDTSSLSAFKESFQAARTKYAIDSMVYLTESDNRLLVNLDREFTMEIFYKQAKKDKGLRLFEVETDVFQEDICMDSNGDRYITEICCSLIRRSDPHYHPQKSSSKIHELQNENRPLILLQDGWIYIKLYQINDRGNEVLQNIFLRLEELGNPKFFYLRYMDMYGQHLRVRLKYENEAAAQKHLLDIQKMLIQFRDNKLVNKVLFDTYFRENNRYGGSSLIEFAENVFFADSQFVVSLFMNCDIETDSALETAYLLGIGTMLTALFDQLEEMHTQVCLMSMLEENKKLFQRKKPFYVKKVEQILLHDYSGLSEQTIKLLLLREKALKNYKNKLLGTKELTNDRENIIAAVLHMFCNRLTGDKTLEQKYINITSEALSNILEKRKRHPFQKD